MKSWYFNILFVIDETVGLFYFDSQVKRWNKEMPSSSSVLFLIYQ